MSSIISSEQKAHNDMSDIGKNIRLNNSLRKHNGLKDWVLWIISDLQQAVIVDTGINTKSLDHISLAYTGAINLMNLIDKEKEGTKSIEINPPEILKDSTVNV